MRSSDAEIEGFAVRARLLTHVAMSESGLSQSIGRLFGWIDRRIKPRFQVDFSVVVLHGKSVQSAIVCDMSETGFGLTKTTGLMPGEPIVITLPDGRTYGGRVVWESEGRAGVAMTPRA